MTGDLHELGDALRPALEDFADRAETAGGAEEWAVVAATAEMLVGFAGHLRELVPPRPPAGPAAPGEGEGR